MPRPTRSRRGDGSTGSTGSRSSRRAFEVRGIGPARAELLAEMFGDLDSLLAASPEEVSTRTGLPADLAGEVLDHLRG